jgi:hypothetical protein
MPGLSISFIKQCFTDWLVYGVYTPLSTLFQLYRGGVFYRSLPCYQFFTS